MRFTVVTWSDYELWSLALQEYQHHWKHNSMNALKDSHFMQMSVFRIQGSNFSARVLKSAPRRSTLIISEISLNVVRKYFEYGGGRVKNGLISAPEAYTRLEPCEYDSTFSKRKPFVDLGVCGPLCRADSWVHFPRTSQLLFRDWDVWNFEVLICLWQQACNSCILNIKSMWGFPQVDR